MLTLVSSGYSSESPNQIINWVNSQGIPLIHAQYNESSGSPIPELVVDNVITITNFVADNSCDVYYQSTYLGSIRGYFGNPKTLILIYREDFIFIEIRGRWGGNTTRGFLFYQKKSDSCLYGWITGALENMVITDSSNDDVYSIATVFKNYSTNIGHLDYTQKRFFKSSVKTETPVVDFYDCSNVDIGNVISFSGNSYYSAGINTLIRVDIQ